MFKDLRKQNWVSFLAFKLRNSLTYLSRCFHCKINDGIKTSRHNTTSLPTPTTYSTRKVFSFLFSTEFGQQPLTTIFCHMQFLLCNLFQIFNQSRITFSKADNIQVDRQNTSDNFLTASSDQNPTSCRKLHIQVFCSLHFLIWVPFSITSK